MTTQPKAHVQVLLATYNGELHLREFLASLMLQIDVEILLLISDDGSTDGTLQIIGEFMDRMNIRLLQGPHKGPAENFHYLIRNASDQYTAFADQDDVWESDHLIKSFERLQSYSEPALTFCSVKEFMHIPNSQEKTWPRKSRTLDISSVMFENYARGCTMMLNPSALFLIRSHHPRNMIMHDWWILIVIISVGKVIWEKEPEVRYRIHGTNAIGPRPSVLIRMSRYLKLLRNSEMPSVNQLLEIYHTYSSVMNSQAHGLLKFLSQKMNQTSASARFSILFWPHRFRNSIAEEVALRLQLIIHQGKIISKEKSH